MPLPLRAIHLVVGLGCLSGCLDLRAAPLSFASVTLKEDGPAATLDLLWGPGTTARHPVILMLGGWRPMRPQHGARTLSRKAGCFAPSQLRIRQILIRRNGLNGWYLT